MDSKTITVIKKYVTITTFRDITNEGLKEYVLKNTNITEPEYNDMKADVKAKAREYIAAKKEAYSKKKEAEKEDAPKAPRNVDKTGYDIVVEKEQRKEDLALQRREKEADEREKRISNAKERYARIEAEKQAEKDARAARKEAAREEVKPVVPPTGITEYDNVMANMGDADIEQSQVVLRLIMAKALYGAEYDQATENWLKQHTR
jgi:beta-glucosidase-like glycosyl hydrolase